MSLSDEQAAFSADVSYITAWVPSGVPGGRIRLLEVKRHPLMQRIYVYAGKSEKLDSYHLALDINGVYQTETEAYRPIGARWEALSIYNRWGGRFGDGNHLERMRHPREEPALEA
jgi:hypothetical protein